MVSTEGPVNVETDKLSLQVEKVTIQDLGRKKNSVKNSEFKPPPPEALGLKESKITFECRKNTHKSNIQI